MGPIQACSQFRRLGAAQILGGIVSSRPEHIAYSTNRIAITRGVESGVGYKTLRAERAENVFGLYLTCDILGSKTL